MLKKLSFDGIESDVVLDAELTAAYLSPNKNMTKAKTFYE